MLIQIPPIIHSTCTYRLASFYDFVCMAKKIPVEIHLLGHTILSFLNLNIDSLEGWMWRNNVQYVFVQVSWPWLTCKQLDIPNPPPILAIVLNWVVSFRGINIANAYFLMVHGNTLLILQKLPNFLKKMFNFFTFLDH
jgi:hypothetical protein